MSEQIEVSREVAAPAEQVWAMIADITRMGEWSPETTGASWVKGSTEPVVGARFQGVNRNGTKGWTTGATVLAADPGERFWFLVTSVGLNVSEWHYDLEPTATGCTVTETWIDRRGLVVSLASPLVSGVKDRAAHNRTTMEQTLERIATVAESVV